MKYWRYFKLGIISLGIGVFVFWGLFEILMKFLDPMVAAAITSIYYAMFVVFANELFQERKE